MNNKKKIFYIAISIIIIILIILFYTGFKKITKAEHSMNENQIQEENIIVENTEESIIENIENNEQNEITNEIAEISNENNTEPVKNETSQSNENNSKKDLEKNSVQKTEPKSTFDENAFTNGHLKKYPLFGEKYATLIISKIGVNASVCLGLTDEILKKGVAEDSGSYLVGEGGTTIMCGHNYMNNFSRFRRALKWRYYSSKDKLRKFLL